MRNDFFLAWSRKSSILLYIYLYMTIFIIQYNDAAFHFFNQHHSVISCSLPVRQYGGCFQKQYLYMFENFSKSSNDAAFPFEEVQSFCPNLYVRSLFQLLGPGPVFQGIVSLQAAFFSIHSASLFVFETAIASSKNLHLFEGSIYIIIYIHLFYTVFHSCFLSPLQKGVIHNFINWF